MSVRGVSVTTETCCDGVTTVGALGCPVQYLLVLISPEGGAGSRKKSENPTQRSGEKYNNIYICYIIYIYM